MTRVLFHLVQKAKVEHFMPVSLKRQHLLPIILAQWHGSISNDCGITRHVSLDMFFSPLDEDWFPLSNEMSCLHFWAGTRLALPQRKNQTQGLAVSILKVRGTGLSSSTAYIYH